ncbi:MAG: two pore domain potassium channel family protein [Chloroflexi bacterium]|nr:two pore domain potassium channel family protein [Chloroflexota bacterium]
MIPILAPFVLMWTFIRELYDLFKSPQYRAILYWMGLLLVTGTLFYNRVEGWGLLDSLYFSVVTLAIVGYGYLSPTTPASKIFTIVYILLGISFFISFVSLLAKERQLMFKQRTHDNVSDPADTEHG